MKLMEAYELYVWDKRLLGYSIHTMKAYTIQVRLLVRHIGNVPIEELSLYHLKEYLATQTHLKPSSLGHRVRFIKSFFKWVHDEGYLPTNISSKLREPKQGNRIPKALGEDDLEELRESCRLPLEHALLEFLYSLEDIQTLLGHSKLETTRLYAHLSGARRREIYRTYFK